MSKRLLYDSSYAGGTLHQELLAGIAQLAAAVGSTLGPRGRHVIIDRAGETPLMTKDGVTVARNIQLSDPVHNAAVKMVQAVSRAAVEESGDGTTSAAVLAHRIFALGTAAVARGANPVLLQRAIQYGIGQVTEAIRQRAERPTDEQIAQVATIATNGDQRIGRLILEAIQKVGREGMITLDDSSTPETWLDLREGFQFESGWISPEFVTDRNRGVAVLENPVIFLTDRLLSQGVSLSPTLHDLGPIMNYAAGFAERTTSAERVREPRPLLIVADEVAGDALTALIANHVRGNLQVCAVRAPGFGELRRAALADMAMVTDGKVLTAESGLSVSRWASEPPGGANFGRCFRALVSNQRTVLEAPPGDAHDPFLVGRFAESLRQQALEMQDPGSRELLLQRAARLTGSVAVIRVGATTEAEARSLRDLVEDAVLAVRAALAEGIVLGGGLCLYSISRALRNTLKDAQASRALSWFRRILPGLGAAPAPSDEISLIAMELLADCLEAPLRLIAANAGEDPDKVVDTIERCGRDRGAYRVGYNAATNCYEDLGLAGIVDPAKVVRVALQKAASIASMLLTSSCLIYFERDQDRSAKTSPIPAQAAQQAVRQ